jgi:von Willebrand factor A domain-containing protein 7
MRPTRSSLFRHSVSMLTIWLLTITVLPLFPARNALAFMPTNSAAYLASASGSSTHESITFDVIKEYDKNLFQLGNKDLTENMKKAQKEIIDADTDVDNIFNAQFNQSASHFDCENFQGSQKRLIDYKLKVKELMLTKKPDVSKARWYLGQALHTLQDFYAHSNWVELGNGAPYGILGVPGNPLTNPLDTTRTCTDCSRDTCTDCYNPSTGLTNLTTSAITTGYYGGDDRAKPNDFKCSHGGKVVFLGGLITSKDSSSKGAIGSGINKDTKKCTISPHNDKHLAAAGVAKQATTEYLDQIKTLIKVPKLKLLLGGGTTLAMAIHTTEAWTTSLPR